MAAGAVLEAVIIDAAPITIETNEARTIIRAARTVVATAVAAEVMVAAGTVVVDMEEEEEATLAEMALGKPSSKDKSVEVLSIDSSF